MPRISHTPPGPPVVDAAAATPLSDERFHFSPTTHLVLLAIFAGMWLGFGALVYQTVQEWRLAPAAPRPLSVAAATALAEPGPAAWISLSDARWVCERPLQHPNLSPHSYGLVVGPAGQRVIVAVSSSSAAPCPPPPGARRDDWFTGLLERRAPGEALPVGVEWSDLPNAHPDGPAWILWTGWTPPGGVSGFLGLLFFAALSLFGMLLFVVSLRSFLRERRAIRVPRRPRLAGARFRLPLSTGASALGIFSLSFGGLQVFVFGWLFFLTLLPNWLGILVGVLAAGWVLATFGAFIEGWKRRASDLLLGAAGFEIRGGPLHGVQHRWEQPEAGEALCSLEHHRATPGAVPPEATCTLRIRGELAAMSADPAEDRSLASIAATLHGVAATPPDAGAGALRRLAVVHCQGCGAPVPPRETGACPYCGHAIALPEPVRQQVRALAARDRDRADCERLLRRALRQPAAARINGLLMLLLPPLLLSWPVAGAVFDEFYQTRHLLRPYHGLALAVAALCGNLALQFLLRGQIAARAAVRIIATHFAARPPAQPGAAPACRACGAPLVVEPGHLLLLCVYCGAENVTGLNLIPVAAAQAAQAGELRAALRVRLRVRRSWRWLALLSLLLLGACALALWPVRSALHEQTSMPRTQATQQP